MMWARHATVCSSILLGFRRTEYPERVQEITFSRNSRRVIFSECGHRQTPLPLSELRETRAAFNASGELSSASSPEELFSVALALPNVLTDAARALIRFQRHSPITGFNKLYLCSAAPLTFASPSPCCPRALLRPPDSPSLLAQS